jgi:hypothetical protein
MSKPSASRIAERHLMAGRVAGTMPKDEGFHKAMAALASVAGLPAWPKTQPVVKIKVPNGFSSLFKNISIELVNMSGKKPGDLYFLLHWKYEHARGSNGYDIGSVMFDPKEGKWGWRMADTNQYGYV